MVYTLTLNPAIDYMMKTKEQLKHYQRLSDYDLIASGKGINVSLQLKNLGVPTVPIAVIGQATGLAYKAMLKMQFDRFVAIETDTLTRINVKLNAAGKTIELNTTGRPAKNHKFITELCDYVKSNVKASDTFAIMGALPYKMPPRKLLPLLHAVQRQKARVVIDMRGTHVLNYGFMRPELIKPNVEELGEFFGRVPKSYKQIASQARMLLDMGFKRVVVSMGKKGSYYFDGTDTMQALPLLVKDVNSAGAGDAMVAGFLAGILENRSDEDCLRLGAACAAAKVASVWYGDQRMVERMADKIVIRRL